MSSNAPDELSRRDFLSVMAASAAMAALTSCSAAPPEKIVPYVRAPEDLLPGKPQFFATAMPTPGYGVGLVVESHEGRPIKIEGNPNHPASLGATDVFSQASLLTLYDPDRAETVTKAAAISTWDEFIGNLQPRLADYDGNGGNGLRVLTETVTSPSLGFLLQALLRKYPNARWHQYDPVNRDNARAGAKAAFGRYVDPIYRFDDADVIVSLDSDFLMWAPGKLHYAREFGHRRKSLPGQNRMNRLYVIESALTITGAKADHRYRVRSSEIRSIARSLTQVFDTSGATSGVSAANDAGSPYSQLIADLSEHRGRSIVIAGDDQPAEVHALVHLLNDRLGNVGKTVLYLDPVEVHAVEQTQSLRELSDDIDANRVTTLIVMGANPVYSAPADFEFGKRLQRVPLKIHQSLYFDETSQLCHWHIPESHYLESWSDVRAFDGVSSIIQPLIVPLYQSRTAHELISALLGDPSRSNYDLVRGYWQTVYKQLDFDTYWNRALRDGVVPDSQFQPVSLTPTAYRPVDASRQEAPGDAIEVVFKPDPSVFDGRWANNAWLQELPKPITRLVWDNAALMSPPTAARLNVKTGDTIEIQLGNRQVRPAVQIATGVADNSITLHLGYGRTRIGRVGVDRGFNAYAIRATDAMSITTAAQVRKAGLEYLLVTTQRHHEMLGRHMARSITVEDYAKSPDAVRDEVRPPEPHETLYPLHDPIDYAWGMSIDLSSCIGCNACVVACQAENNIPTVGKDQVNREREMHWLRIDMYETGDPNNPEMLFEPMLCQHCEYAPCELVCPVEATSHSAEGLNEMTYNRCVGTRYCSNNCPYKVRRFNFYQYADWNTPQLKLLYNPDVTVRSRGVMEKCTYCVQRINRARIEAKLEDRKIRDGDVVTACQQVCPAEAITFGNTLDRNAVVSKAKQEPRNYGVLEELNTRPRTTYLANLKNPRVT